MALRHILGSVKPEKQPIPEAVDRQQFTGAVRKLLATKPMPKPAIPRKRSKPDRQPNLRQQ